MFPPPLPPDLTSSILAYLGCPPRPPSARSLNELARAYIRRVPWESVTRLLRRHDTPRTADCPRWPEEFWAEALAAGTGGTCFENNLAFFSLLAALGYTGYLTINDMPPQRLCHTAIIILLHGQKYLVDVAIPLHCVLPVHPGRLTRRWTLFHQYTLRPAGEGVYQVERSHHPKRYIYTLLDRPVPPDEYRAAVERDYEPMGFFLDQVIIVKVIGDRLWRFNSLERPYVLQGFNKAGKVEVPLAPESLPRALAQKFDMPEGQIAAAIDLMIQSPGNHLPKGESHA